MHRCFVEPRDWRDRTLVLSEPEAHHLIGVLRAGEGDEVEVFDGRGRIASARVPGAASAGRKHAVVLDLVSAVRCEPPPVHVTLVQAVLKGKRMDWLVEKATELGVAEIRPVLSARTVASAEREARAARWQRTALSAAKQCGTAWVPVVHPPAPFAAVVADGADGATMLVGALSPGARPLQAVLRRAVPGAVVLLIGPEGDWTDAELETADRAGAVRVSFGPRVLRSETAAIFGLSALVYEWASRPSDLAPCRAPLSPAVC